MESVVTRMKVLAVSPRENDTTPQQVDSNNSRRGGGAGGSDDSELTSCNYCIGVSVYTKYVDTQ